MQDWLLQGRKDTQSVTPDWRLVDAVQLDGVVVKAIGNVVTDNGWLTEIYRDDWGPGPGVGQVFQRVLEPGALSAWHAHAVTTDRLFCGYGRIRLVLYDGRRQSPTAGQVAVIRLGQERPALVTLPSGIWHGVVNIGAGTAILVNVVDQAYRYDDPDHWRLPADTPEIPYRFA